jgi:hypothetical protein
MSQTNETESGGLRADKLFLCNKKEREEYGRIGLNELKKDMVYNQEIELGTD